MAEKSAFWTTNNTGDGPTAGYAQDRMQDVMRTLSTIDPTLYYVAPARLNEYSCAGSSSPLSVNTGEAFVNGRHHLADAAVSVSVPTPVTSTRIDRIILRSDGTAQTVRVVRLAGTEGSGVPPTLTQNSTTYEVSLWKATITTGGVITLVDERGYMGLRGLADNSTLEWDTTNKKLRIKDLGVTTAKIADASITSAKLANAISYADQMTFTRAGQASSSAIVASSTLPSIFLAETDQAADEKNWDISASAKTFAIRSVNDASSSAVIAMTITRGSGTAISAIAFPSGNVNISNAVTVGSLSSTGQIVSTKSGAGFANAAFLASAAVPSYTLNETDAAADEKVWDIVVDGKSLFIRAMNDAGSSATNAITIARGTGTAISSVTIGGTTVAVTNAMTVGAGLSVTGNISATGTVTAVNVTASGTITGTPANNFISAAAQITDGVVTTAKHADGSITTVKIADSNVTAVKLASDAVTTVKILDANVTTAKLADGAATTAKVADDAIDDTKAGNRVVQLYRRQGGSATDWASAGTSTQTPTSIREYVGCVAVSLSAEAFKAVSITFPTGFSAKPLVIATCEGTAIAGVIVSSSITSSGCTLTLYSTGGANTGTYNLHWRAIGPE